jgi:hypothetical protein
VNLPSLVTFGGDWGSYVEKIYKIYIETIVNGSLKVDGYPVRCKFRPPSQEKGFGFWHIIQEGFTDEERTPDLRRCERIEWVSWMIKQLGKDIRITWWEEKRDREKCKLLWLEEEDYLIILAKRKNYWLLKTAYLTDRSHKRKQLQRNREIYWATQKA